MTGKGFSYLKIELKYSLKNLVFYYLVFLCYKSFKRAEWPLHFLYHLNLRDKTAIDLYASNIGKIIKYINTTRSTEFKYDIINIFHYCY